MRKRVASLLIGLWVFAVTTPSSADHERFLVGAMQDTDPTTNGVTSTSGKCVPSHDRDRLECYFTTFALWKRKTEEQAKKDIEEGVRELDKDLGKGIAQVKKDLCDPKTKFDPVLLKYNTSYRAVQASSKAFCDRPTRDSLLAVFRTMIEGDVMKCNCVVSDFRATFIRQSDRWIANVGPEGLCGVINVFTLVPNDLKKMKQPIGPVLWTLTQKTVTTHRTDDPLCANPQKNPLIPTIKEGSTTVSWNAPSKSIECREFEFTSALEGMSDPRGPKGTK